MLWVAPLLFVGVLFYLPLARILSLGISGDWLTSIWTPHVLGIFWFTLWQAAISATACIALGVPGAYLLFTRKFHGQHLLKALITVPFVLPTIVVAIGFTSFRNIALFAPILKEGSYVPIILLANIFMNYAIAVRIIGTTWSNLDPSVEDAAALDGAGRLRTFTSVTFPNLRASIASAGALIFLYCAASFGLVLVLGGGKIKTIETEIYLNATQYLDLRKTAGLVLLQTIITAIAFLLSRNRGDTGFVESRSGEPSRRVDIRDLPVVILTFAFISLVIALPIIKIVVEAFSFGGRFSLQNFENLTGKGARELLNISVAHAALNSLRNTIIASFISIFIGVSVSYLISRRHGSPLSQRFRSLLDIGFQAPVGISTVVLGFGYLITFTSGFFPLRSSWLATPLVASLIATPLVVRLVHPALLSIDRELLESAATEGATDESIWTRIEAPLIRNALLTALGFSALISIGEFGAANFLAYGDQATLPIILFQLISRPGSQNYGMAMAASSLLILFVAVIIYFVTRVDD